METELIETRQGNQRC